ncbi:MAG: hypothetical protein R3E01_00155 [Pirellulaceae bacterium]|nr:hypothetical protein [Planctomycetales bacterium]
MKKLIMMFVVIALVFAVGCQPKSTKPTGDSGGGTTTSSTAEKHETMKPVTEETSTTPAPEPPVGK